MRVGELIRCIGHIIALKAVRNTKNVHALHKRLNLRAFEQEIIELIRFLAAGCQIEPIYLPLVVYYIDQLEVASEPLLVNVKNADQLICVILQLI